MKPALRRLLLALAVVLALALFVWALRDVSLPQLMSVLSTLQPWQILAILLVNFGLILLFAVRWWLVLRQQGHRLPLLTVARYRLAAFAVNYITPGQHYGGEPLQVLLLSRRGVPAADGIASVALDKLMEIFANFLLLAGGIALLLSSDLFPGLPLRQTLRTLLPAALAVLAAALVYLVAAGRGWRPLGRALRNRQGKLARALASAEDQLGSLAARPRVLLALGLASALTWAGLLFEFWLMLRFLGLHLTGLQALVLLLAGRIALLAPTPGALGALEASQVLAVQALGLDPAYGLALGLLIRARDVFFSALSLAVGGAEALFGYRRTPS